MIDLPNENFEYGYPHSNALLQFHLELEHCKPHKVACHPIKCEVINDVKQFLTVYRMIYCRKFLTSNQMSCYKSKCIRIYFIIIANYVYNFMHIFIFLKALSSYVDLYDGVR